MKKPHPFLALTAAVILFAQAATLNAAPIADFFAPNENWSEAADVELAPDARSFTVTEGVVATVLYANSDSTEPSSYLTTAQNFSDQVVSFDFMVGPNTDAGVYLQGRYEVKLSADEAGTLSGGFNRNTQTDFAPQAAISQAAKPAGEWNTITLRFRTLRNDAANNKLSNSILLEASLNGKVVQRDAQIEYYTPGSILEWEQSDGPLTFRATKGPFAIRNFQIDHADYEAVVLNEPGQATNAQELVDQVKLGKETFAAMGCIECHTTKFGDTSFKTGPNLYGLFQRLPQKHEIFEPASDARFSIEADLSYAKRSIRTPAAELAIAKSGPTAGQAYLPVMVPYSEETLSNAKVDAIYRYLSTLNAPAQRGPLEVLVTKDGPTEYDPLADTMEIIVRDRTRIQRGSMKGVSGRSIHVGQPNGVNYTFDPRTLAIEKIWQGGFLNAAGEWENRGGNGFAPGFQNKEINLAEKGGLIAPLNSQGEPIDFSFKNAIFHDFDTIDASLHNAKDHLQLLAEIHAQFLGYTLPSTPADASPTFHYQVEDNNISVQTLIEKDGTTQIHLSGSLASEQKFNVNTVGLTNASTDAGELSPDGILTLPASKTLDATLSGKLSLASNVWRPETMDTTYLDQELTIEATDAQLPAGYRSEQFIPPHDNSGRSLLFEATAIDVAPDGTIVVGTRTAGIWRIVDGKWHLFAEGLFDCLGLVVEDEKGLTIVAGQKPELTRITDVDGDGIADTYDTLSDQFSYHSNYHSYMHGPVRDAEGNYYYNLNLLHADDAIFKGGGLYMGSSGGFSGWSIKITPEGEFIPYAYGLRSPASLGIDPQGTIWYADNQGEYVSTSKLFILEPNKYYGHPAGLVDLPGLGPESPELQWPAAAENRETAVALFPHNRVANSPGHMAWDTTGGKFGPYSGQMFIGDQTQSKLLRVTTFQIDGETRAAVIPFGKNLQSGVMRPVFTHEGDLLLGQTGRGWQAHGGKIASLQRIIWDGHTEAQAILSALLESGEKSIVLNLTQALGESVTAEQLQAAVKVSSWMYRDAPDYGSPELDTIEHTITAVSLSPDRKQITLELAPETFGTHPFQTSRVYHVQLPLEQEHEAYITGK